MNSLARRIQPLFAGLLTIVAILTNYLSAVSIGPLWRDEANTVAVATLPTFADVWNNLQFDSFPIVWMAVVRGYAAVFGTMNDPAFRVLGFVIALTLIASLWFNARAFGHGFPLTALALVALSPSVVRWGGSMRAYGLGLALIAFTSGLLWRYVERPDRRRWIAATVLATLSVQTLFFNSVLLLALCAGGVSVIVYRRQFRQAYGVIGIGLTAAVSLLPYVTVIHRAALWNEIVRIPVFTIGWFSLRLFETITEPGGWTFFAWLYAGTVGLCIGFAAVFAPQRTGISRETREISLFAVVTLFVGAVGSFAFLKALRYYTQPWYYLTLLLILGLSLDVLLHRILVDARWQVFVATAAAAAGFAAFLNAPMTVVVRMTNALEVSTALSSIATADDFIIVNPWYEGVSFDRYYHGKTPWMTLPEVPFHRFHRYDILLQLDQDAARSTAVMPVLDKAERTLTAGHTVYVVGALPPPRQLKAPNPSDLAPVPVGELTQAEWPLQLGEFLRGRATTITPVAIPSHGPVGQYEDMTVSAVRGWKQ